MKLNLAIATLVLAASTAANAAAPTIERGVSLRTQIESVAAREGYTLVWRVAIDAPAQDAARTYASWTDAVYGATRELSLLSYANSPPKRLYAPIVCDLSKTIVITSLDDGRRIIDADRGRECHALK